METILHLSQENMEKKICVESQMKKKIHTWVCFQPGQPSSEPLWKQIQI